MSGQQKGPVAPGSNEGNLVNELVSGREIRVRDDFDVFVSIFPSPGEK
jgi:hypothetical protein